MLQVIVDTNIFIDALFKNDEYIATIFDYERVRKLKFIVCDETVNELYYKLEEIGNAMRLQKSQINYNQSFVGKIMARSFHTDIDMENCPRYCEDRDDDMFIECAKVGQADYVLSSDKHITCLPKCIMDIHKLGFKVIDILDFLADIDYYIATHSALQNNNKSGIRFAKVKR